MAVKNAKIKLLDAKSINSIYNTNYNVIVLNETTSTNEYAKNLMLNGEKSAVVLSESQTGGKGRLNRSFYSPKHNGVYMSVCFRPNFNVKNANKLTTLVSVIVAKSLEKVAQIKVDIKWVNDLYVNGKKVCGILTESCFDYKNNKMDYVVVGIGVNVTGTEFPKEIESIATSIEKESGKIIDRNVFVAEILKNFKDLESQILNEDYLKEYKARSNVLNKQIAVVSLTESYSAFAVDILNNGALLVKRGEELLELVSADISIKDFN